MDDMNSAINEAPDEAAPPYFGWYWRDVDFDANSVTLAFIPVAEPSWHPTTLEAMTGKRWNGGDPDVRFCENNKWGYPMFKVTGDHWAALKGHVTALIEDPTDAMRATLVAFMNGLLPEGWRAETCEDF